MAQAQPMSSGPSSQSSGQPMPISNVLYDLATVISNCGEAVQALTVYIDDARQDNNRDVLDFFEQARQDEIRHCEVAREVIRKMVQQGTL